VEGTGDHANPWLRLTHNMDVCKKALMHWQREEVGRPNRFYAEQCKKLAILQGDKHELDVGQALEIQREFKILMEKEELKWKQRTKTDWLTCGDRNSKFFHACANQRWKVNKISHIYDEGGRLWET
jgi:hypothetical protein